MSLLASLFHHVPAGEQQPAEAASSLADLLASLLEIGQGLLHAGVLAAAIFGFGGGAEVR